MDPTPEPPAASSVEASTPALATTAASRISTTTATAAASPPPSALGFDPTGTAATLINLTTATGTNHTALPPVVAIEEEESERGSGVEVELNGAGSDFDHDIDDYEEDDSYTDSTPASSIVDAPDGMGPFTPLPAGPPPSGLRHKYHRHMARSAAKRESVQALPSIRDLQLQFSGGGARVEHRAGLGVGIRSSPLAAMLQDDEGEGRRDRLQEPRPWKEVQLARVNAAEASAEATRLVATIRKRWGPGRGSPPSSPGIPPEDLRGAFVETARAVRRVRTLALALVPTTGQRRASGPVGRSGVPTFSTPSRPAVKTTRRVVSGASDGRHSSVPPPVVAAPDPIARVRRAALDLLAHLRHLEERTRLQHEKPPKLVVIPDGGGEPTVVESPVAVTHGADTTSSPPNRSDNSSPAFDSPRRYPNRRLSSPSKELLYSPASSNGDLPYDDYSDNEDYFNVNDLARELENEDRPREPWEDRLLSEDRRYKAVSPTAWSAESRKVSEAAARWADAVERAFGGERAPAGPTGAWARETNVTELERARAFIAAHLSEEHVKLLPQASDPSALLARLSDGYLLIQAFNSHVLASKRPWGDIPDEDIHETVSTAPQGETAAREWTFRLIGNLTPWAAALRHRYNLPLVMPATPSSVLPPATEKKTSPRRGIQPSAPPSRRRDIPQIDFDPSVVAKKSEGWESMLSTLLNAWVSEAAHEAGGSRVVSAALSSTPSTPPTIIETPGEAAEVDAPTTKTDAPATTTSDEL